LIRIDFFVKLECTSRQPAEADAAASIYSSELWAGRPHGSNLESMMSYQKIWLHQSINAYLPEEQTCQISSWSDL